MTPAQAEHAVNTDMATMLIVSGLVSFLEKKGLISEEEIMTYLRGYVETGTMDPDVRAASVRRVSLLQEKAF